jgi:hypothetical protein
VTLPAGEIFSALPSGTIDAAEFVGPFSDAPARPAPGGEELLLPGRAGAVLGGGDRHQHGTLERPAGRPEGRGALAALSLHEETTTEYDTRHPIALQELVTRHGVTVREVPRELLTVFGNTAGEMLAEFRRPPGPAGEADRRQLRRVPRPQPSLHAPELRRLFDARALPIRWG